METYPFRLFILRLSRGVLVNLLFLEMPPSLKVTVLYVSNPHLDSAARPPSPIVGLFFSKRAGKMIEVIFKIFFSHPPFQSLQLHSFRLPLARSFYIPHRLLHVRHFSLLLIQPSNASSPRRFGDGALPSGFFSGTSTNTLCPDSAFGFRACVFHRR